MKRFLIFTVLWAAPFFMFAQETAVEGVWVTAKQDGHIRIFKSGSHFFGSLAWMKDPIDPETGQAQKDKHNPNPALRGKPLLGMLLLQNFSFDGTHWVNGKVYDPENGKTYQCKMKLIDANTLEIRGYVGVSLIGRSEIWKRKKA